MHWCLRLLTYRRVILQMARGCVYCNAAIRSRADGDKMATHIPRGPGMLYWQESHYRRGICWVCFNKRKSMEARGQKTGHQNFMVGCAWCKLCLIKVWGPVFWPLGFIQAYVSNVTVVCLHVACTWTLSGICSNIVVFSACHHHWYYWRKIEQSALLVAGVLTTVSLFAVIRLSSRVCCWCWSETNLWLSELWLSFVVTWRILHFAVVLSLLVNDRTTETIPFYWLHAALFVISYEFMCLSKCLLFNYRLCTLLCCLCASGSCISGFWAVLGSWISFILFSRYLLWMSISGLYKRE